MAAHQPEPKQYRCLPARSRGRSPHRRRVVQGLAIAVSLMVFGGGADPFSGVAHAEGLDTSIFGGPIAPGEVGAQVEIDAPAEHVWAALMDLPSYPIWNPFISSIEGTLRPGGTLQVSLHVGGRSVTYQATVLAVTPNRLVSWSGESTGGVFNTIFSFGIEPVRPGRVRFVARETRKGVAQVVEWLLGSDIQSGLDQMAKSLRNRVELMQIAWPSAGRR